MKEDRIRNLDRRKAADKEDEQSEITAWVNRSRKLQEQAKVNEKEKAARMARTLAEQEFEEKSDEEYETKDLAGLKIRHGLDKVMEGGAVVLTLKDRNILDGDDVDEEMDELENIEIAEQKAREDAYKAAKKKPGIYEDKFHNEFSEPRTILPQYDDVVKDDGVVLDETGGINEQSRKRLEEIRQRLQNATVRGLARDSVASEAARVAADFYTQEEMLQFKKPKKKKKLRKKIDIDIDALEAEAKAAGLGTGDLGSRVSAGRNGKKEEERAVADSKRNAYQNAYVKALEASKVLLSESSAAMDMDTDGPVFGADEDDELHRSLERARFAALKKQAENGGSVAGPQAVAARLAALKEETGSGSQHQGVAEGETEKPIVITDTGEFCLSLQLDEVISRRAGAKDVFGEEDDVGPAATKDLEVANKEGGWIEVREVDQKDSLSAEEEEENILEEPIQEVAVGKGLAGALNLLKERGTLKETIDWGGRNMDKKRSKLVGIVDDNPPEQTRQRDILLDRVDEFGRTMTPKEAFRRLSHKFHGKGPGKMKQEKKMKQYQEELKLKQMNSGDTPLMSMEKMREAQAKMRTPYIVISGHIKPGQTSDPRSGFATVEKEPIGSLTPMLGDKKVEHFLGIKRKSEVGSMGPPPPKKPKSER
ncbi:hypothetical protein O6H91_11G038800 [Diphasiastrum complanatum]|nr:hypothetical protein O6H91_11G038800 [Diphasiastrum complanatum]